MDEPSPLRRGHYLNVVCYFHDNKKTEGICDVDRTNILREMLNDL